MPTFFSLGMWGAALIGFGLVFLIFALVFSEKGTGAWVRAGLALAGVFGLACIFAGIVFIGHASPIGPTWHGFLAFAAYAFSLAAGVIVAALFLAILNGSHHPKLLWNSSKF